MTPKETIAFLRQRLNSPMPDSGDIASVAQREDVIAAVEQLVSAMPPDTEFESFSELRKRKDALGVVRLTGTEWEAQTKSQTIPPGFPSVPD